MARASKSSSAVTKPALAGSPLLRWFFQPKRLLKITLFAGACAVWPYAIEKLPNLSERPEYRIALSQIQLIPMPTLPVPVNLLEQVAQQAGLPDELSLLDETLTVDLASAFRRHPWVAKVVRVRKSFPASITVELEYRRPVLMAQVPDGQIPLDADGIILPTADFSAADASQYPILRNVSAKPKLRPGSVWDDPVILSATRLAETVSEKWKLLKFEAIIVPSEVDPATDPKDVLLEILGQGGSRIVWGRPPGSDHPGELEASQKIRRLEKYLADFGDYGQPNGPYEIDIRHWQEISRRRLTSEQAQAKPAKPPKSDARIRTETGTKLREAVSSGPGKTR